MGNEGKEEHEIESSTATGRKGKLFSPKDLRKNHSSRSGRGNQLIHGSKPIVPAQHKT
jgi:hypothetical protein